MSQQRHNKCNSGFGETQEDNCPDALGLVVIIFDSSGMLEGPTI